jgi:probable DNA metabolism protein
MLDYLYDESFDGLLTAIYWSYYGEPAAGIYPAGAYQITLTQGWQIVETDAALASRVYNALVTKTSREALRKIYYVFLSADRDKGNLILAYVRKAFRLGFKINYCRTDPDVLPIEVLSDRVDTEYGRMLGFVRFADMGEFLYAPIAPDHNVLPLLAHHFRDRLAGEQFMIHDTGRELALVYDKKDCYFTPFAHHGELPQTEQEQQFQKLWQEYFTNIGIKNRFNPRLQTQFVPKRYRANLTEFQ